MPGYISEFSYSNTGSPAFVEIAVPTGTDVSGYTLVVYRSNGHVDATYSFGSPDATIAGQDVYSVQNEPSGSFPVVGTDAFALVDDLGNVVQFIGQSSVTATQGPAAGMTSTDVGQTQGSTSLQSDDGGASYYQQADKNPGTIPCYAPGTMIYTPDGQRAVETLQVGELIRTLDNGPQTIRWVRSGDQPLGEVENDAKPVLITAGALGAGLPMQDMIVSPQHRILVGGGGQLQDRFETEAFAPAKSLTSLPGIRHMKGKRKITWVHFACDRHEIVTANGCLSESLLLGPMVLNGLTSMERQALNNIFGAPPASDAALNGPAARECLMVGAVRRRLQERSTDNAKRFSREIQKWDLDTVMERYEAERLRQARTTDQGRNGARRLA